MVNEGFLLILLKRSIKASFFLVHLMLLDSAAIFLEFNLSFFSPTFCVLWFSKELIEKKNRRKKDYVCLSCSDMSVLSRAEDLKRPQRVREFGEENGVKSNSYALYSFLVGIVPHCRPAQKAVVNNSIKGCQMIKT